LSVLAYVCFIIRSLQRQSVTTCPEAFLFYRLLRPKDMTGRKQLARTNRVTQAHGKWFKVFRSFRRCQKHNMERFIA